MPILYNRKEINDIIRELKIRPIEGKIDSKEAAAILTWRAKHEQNEPERTYTAQSIRRHVSLGNLTAYPQPPKHGSTSRYNLYEVGDVFGLPLAPKRGAKHTKIISNTG